MVFWARGDDDGRYLVIAVEQNGKTQNGVYYADLGDPSAPRLGAPIVRLLDQFDAEYLREKAHARDRGASDARRVPRGSASWPQYRGRR